MDETILRIQREMTRRSFLSRTATGIGTLALGSLLDPALLAGAARAEGRTVHGAVYPLHFPPKAKRVIQLYM
ncbi:MAG: hypothetical protein JWN14_2412, partial [Chthonomonadales bacterium]|nr:hypothetical protein [Chthonomonadales bacterium]